MNTFKRLNRMILLIGISSFIYALFFSILNFALGLEWVTSYGDEYFSFGWIVYRDMAIRYFAISLIFLIFAVFFREQKQILLQIIGIVLLIVAMIQCWVLIASKPGEIPDWITSYAKWLRLVWQTDIVLFVAAIILVVLQLCLIKLNYLPFDNHIK